jgi:tetratricopeptide (TPR) repeat protein
MLKTPVFFDQSRKICLQSLRGRLKFSNRLVCRTGVDRQDDPADFRLHPLCCYMEVAIMTQISSLAIAAKTARFSVVSLSLSLLLTTGIGCAASDSLTYAKDASHQGMALYQDGDYVDASAAFASATRQNPCDYASYYYLGCCYQEMGSVQQSIGAYRSCLDIMPMTLEGKQNLYLRYKTMDALAAAIAKSATCSDEITAMEKKCAGKASVDDQWMLAKVYRCCGDADAAVEAYNKCVLIDPSRFEIAKEAGLYEAVLGQNERAAFTLKKAYAVKSDDPQVNSALHKLGVVTG